MHLFLTSAAALAVAVLYYLWRDGWRGRRRHERRLHERVAYMLWVMAQRGEENDLTVPCS
jgi:hypothetical protein